MNTCKGAVFNDKNSLHALALITLLFRALMSFYFILTLPPTERKVNSGKVMGTDDISNLHQRSGLFQQDSSDC